MKRWLLGLLLGAAVLLLLSPGIIGLIAERQLDTRVSAAGDENPAYRAITERFERRWFTSDGLHRVPLDNPNLRKWLTLLVPETPPLGAGATLLIETEVSHGLLPAGTLVPALASGVSTLTIETPDGQNIALPGELHSRIGLDGQLHLRYPLPAGQRQVDDLTASIQAGEASIESDATGRDVTAALALQTFAFGEKGRQLTADALRLRAGGRQTPYGFPAIDSSVQGENLIMTIDGQAVAVQALKLDYRASADAGRATFSLSFDVDDAAIADGSYGLDGQLGIGELDATKLGDVLRRVQQGTLYGNDGSLHPFLDNDLRALLSAGGSVTLRRLLLATPQGTLEADLDLTLPGFDRPREWAGLLLGASGTAQLIVPQASAQAMAPAGQTLQQLLALGFLVPYSDNGRDLYRMNIELGQGQLRVNGAPLPLNLQTLQAL